MIQQLFLLFFALILASPSAQLCAADKACGALSRTLAEADSRARGDDHVLKVADGYEVLVPVTRETFRIVKVSSQAEANSLARSIAAPLNLDAIIDSEQKRLPELFKILEPIRISDPSVAMSGRVKESTSLKGKIFDRVRKKKLDFKLSDVDDLVGARFATTTLADVKKVAAQVALLPGVHLSKPEVRDTETGYRAIHVTIESESGAVFEVQVMTKRMLAWTLWNSVRVYKPSVPHDLKYKEQLLLYDREVVEYLRALDDGKSPAIKPDPDKYQIYIEDEFPPESLK